MSRKFFRKHLPSEQSLRQHKHLRRLAPLFRHPTLFHLNRHAVARGVAFGAFGGLIPGPFQMLTAAGLSILFRGNLAVAVFVTLYTNPVTILPLYLLGYRLGSWALGNGAGFVDIPDFNWSTPLVSAQAIGIWAMSLGKPLLLGITLLALGLALIGYVSVQLLWRLSVMWRWHRRKQRHQQALGQSK